MKVPRLAPEDGLYRGAKNRKFIQDGLVHSDAYFRRPPTVNPQGILQEGDSDGLSIGFAEMEDCSVFRERMGTMAKCGVIGISVQDVTKTGLGVEPTIETPDDNVLHGNIAGMPYAETTEQMSEDQKNEVDPLRAQTLQQRLADASICLIQI